MTEECMKKNTNRIINAFGGRLGHWLYYINDIELIHTEHMCGQVHRTFNVITVISSKH